MILPLVLAALAALAGGCGFFEKIVFYGKRG